MARKKSKGTPLRVFSGKEESLNRVMLQILKQKGALIPYDVWLIVKANKGFRHIEHKTVCRRMQALKQQGWVAQKGKRHTKPSGDGQLYELTLRGKAALRLDEKSIEEFLQTASDEQLLKLIEALG